MEFKDYYSTLGVSKSASDKEIKQAFRKLARKFHPDVNPGDAGAEARFKEINEAYEVLGNPEKRRKYDELGANWRLYEQGQPGGGFAGGPFGGRAQYTWTSSGGFRPMTEDEITDMFGDAEESPFSEFFRTFFGGAGDVSGGRRRGRARSQRGRDIEHPIELSVEEALGGCVQRLSLRHDGHLRTVEVRIPPGVTEGSRVRVAGEGGHGTGSAASGDLFLRVHLRPHPLFEVRGRDVYTRTRVPLTTAVLGGEVDVAAPAGKPLRLKIPPGTQPGQRFRLRGHGFPVVGRPAERGDLYATVDVEIPTELSEQERAHYEALRRLMRKSWL